MGSYEEDVLYNACSIALQLDPLTSDGHHGISPIEFVELCWAVTTWVYRGDNTVEAIRFVDNFGQSALHTAPLPQKLTIYEIDGEMTVSSIIAMRQTSLETYKENDEMATRIIESETSHRAVLLVGSGYYEREMLKQSLELTSQKLALYVSLSEKVIRATVTSTKNDQYPDAANYVADTFQQVYNSIIRDWSLPMNRIEIVGQRAQNQILKTTKPPIEWVDAFVGDELLECSKDSSEVTAIDAWDGKFTYADFYALSRCFAASLIQKGVSTEEKIPICMRKSKWVPVAIVGIMMAGATCVPIDIRSPQSRINELVKRLAARYVVATSEAARFHDTSAIPLDCSDLSQRSYDARLDWPTINSKSAALIFFTSGSTGVPKGVVWEHGAFYSTLVHLSKAYALDPDSRILQYSSYIFDVSTGDMFAAMFRRACVCIPSEDQRLDNVSAFIRDKKVSHACLTNTVLAQIQPENVPSLQYLFVGGEAFDKAQYHRWHNALNLCVVYGTTESLIWDSIARSDNLATQHNNIGFSFGPSLWVVDADDANILKPIGAIGEILLEGATLARGYLEPEKSSNPRFMQAPTWLQRHRGHGQIRCYRTGDIGYRNPDGSIAILGRADTQVKIRGQRIELGEIEHSLRQISAPSEQIVVDAIVLEEQQKSKVLASFYIKHGDDGDNVDILPMTNRFREEFKSRQKLLSHYLPSHMIPLLFFPIQRLPLTAAGKLDRKVLRLWVTRMTPKQLASYYLIDASNTQPPETDNELLLQQLWADVLQTSSNLVGRDDDFFRFGADSVKAIELVAALRMKGKALGVAKVFQHSKLCDMALLLKDLNEQDSDRFTLAAFDLLGDQTVLESCLASATRICQVGEEVVENIYPTTPIQEALMAITVRRPNTYQCRLVFKIPASLDIRRFKEAWERVVANQSILRTRIVVCGGVGALQVVLRSQIRWHHSRSLVNYSEFEQQHPFTYGTELSRVAIVKQDTGTFFVWNCHHSIYDAWSQPKILDAVQTAYQDLSPVAQVSYDHFIGYLTDLQQSDAETYWKDQFPSMTEMFPSLPSVEYQPEAKRSLSLSIKAGRRNGSAITTATVVQAAWALIIAQQVGSNDAVFGLTLSGRDVPLTDVTNMLGPTITTVPIRINVDNSQSIQEYLQEVQNQILAMKAYQHTGLQQIRQYSPECRNAANIQNLLVIHPAEHKPASYFSKLGLQLIELEETDCEDRLLTVQCTVQVDTIDVKAIYDETVIPERLMSLLLCRLENVISQLMTESPDQSIYNLNQVSDSDLAILADWNASTLPNVDATLHELVEAEVLRNPTSIAISGFDGDVTYAELDSAANALSAHLSQKGVGPETRVVLCFAKSAWPIIAMLAILKSGGVCVSVNPDHPLGRLLEVYEDVQATMLLCDTDNVARFAEHIPSVSAINADTLSEIGTQPRPIVNATPSNGAFVIYTSGSTGKPKGTLLEHRSLATSLRAIGSQSGMTNMTRTLQFSAYTFDAHVLEIFGTLIHGGCICVISDHERMDKLEQTMKDRLVNWALLTPTVARMLQPLNIPALETLILSGEPLAQQDLQQWADYVMLLNGLGPSECSILACITGKVSANGNPANIGHPLGCRLWITDHRRPDRLMPVGCIGELVVEGNIVGRGYVNRPKATAAAFITDPAWSRNGSGHHRRFYRTGDLAKFNLDGSVFFIGRADTQVKIRGQRVELGEIEYALKACGLLEPAAVDVIKVPSRGNMQSLAVFLTSSTTTNPSASNPILTMDDPQLEVLREVQKKLGKILPKYMVPSVFFPVRKLPISPNGKLERKTLRQWASELSRDQVSLHYLTESTASRPLTTENEKLLHRLWVKVLQVPDSSIGADENFFQLGGDSVMAMEMIAIARGQGLSLTVSDIFQCPQLSTMALSLGSLEKTETDETIKPFTLVANKMGIEEVKGIAAEYCQVGESLISDLYPCSALQEGLMAITARLPRTYIHQAVYTLPESLDLERFKQAWEDLAIAHAIVRTRIVVMPKLGAMQVVLSPSQIHWRTATSLRDYLRKDQQEPMTYGDSLSRWAIVNENGATKFVWTVHHAIYDGWSLPRMLNEVRQNYEHCPVATSVHYNKFVQHIASITKEDSDAFWKGQFATACESYPCLPSADYVPKPCQKQGLAIKLARPSGFIFTMATVVQAAWALVTAQRSGGDAATFGLTLSGRDTPVPGIIDMMGPTITTVPIRIETGKQTIGEYLAAVQEQVVLLRKYQHTGLQHIRRLSPEASTAVEFQNLLVIQTIGDDQINSPLRSLGIEIIPQEEDEFLNLALTMEVVIRSDTAHVTIQHDPVMISNKQVTCMLNQVQQIAHELLSKPQDTLITNIDFLSPHDRQQLAVWQSLQPTATEATIHDLVAHQTSQNPQAFAITGCDGQYTYSELDGMTCKLASYLMAQGVGPEVRVILCFTKSMWPIVAMLAVLKAGGVCVSINPDHPIQRQLETYRDAAASVLLCDPERVSEFVKYVPNVVAVDGAFFSQIAALECDWTSTKIMPSNAAFIIYTSGSTGKPKGTILEHRSLCTSLLLNGKATNMGPHTKTLQFTAFTFDIHILEIFGTLIHGGCVCVISDEERFSDLAGTINRLQVNRAMFTPTVANLLTPAQVPTLNTITLAGEPVTRANIETWADRIEIYNSWGPSETCIGSSITQRLTRASNPNNIGRPLGCRLWITDRSTPNILSPLGCVGEILIEGPIVGRGYVNRPEATDAAFIDCPTWSRGKSFSDCARRFYRTGDLAKYDDDGTIIFVGRADAQVKLRGQRIELGEIEYHLKSCHLMSESIAVEVINVTARKDTQALVAFIEYPSTKTEEGPIQIIDPSRMELFRMAQQELATKLPQYMIPSIYLPVNQLPVSPSGKLERKILRQWALQLSCTHQIAQFYLSENVSHEAPETENEMALQKLWSNVLRISENDFSINDNFVRLGGDSVMAIEMIALARSQGLLLTATDVFRHPRLKDMALTLRRAQLTEITVTPFMLIGSDSHHEQYIIAAIEGCNVKRDAIEDMYPCSALQEAMLATTIRLPHTYTHQGVYKIPSTINLTRFKAAWEASVAAHPILRTRVLVLPAIGSMQVVLRTNISWIHDTCLETYLEQDRAKPIVYGGELCRFAVIQEATGDAKFVWTVHHAVYDGWSLPQLLNEVQQNYEGNTPDSAVPYNRFIHYLVNIDTQESDHFWRSQFSTTVETYPRLPTRTYVPRPREKQRFEVHFRQSSENKTTNTIATVIQAAWALVTAKHAGTNKAQFALTLSGRDASIAGITKIMGPTIATVPIQVDINPAQPISEYLAMVQEQVVLVRRYQYAGLQNIRRLSPEARAAVDFQNLLVIQNGADRLGTSGLEKLGLEPLSHSAEEEGFLNLALTAEATVLADRVCLSMHYDDQVVVGGEVTNLLNQFQQAMSELLERPGTATIGEIDLLSRHDLEQITAWNDDKLPVVEATIHELVEAQVRVRPNAIAATGMDGDFTYAQLDNLANVLADHLVGSLGVGPEVPVVLCFSKSVWALIAMLAVLKSGGGCVSVNPDHPTSRIQATYEDVEATVLLCDTSNAVRLSGCISTVIEVNSDLMSMPHTRLEQSRPVISPSNTAFIIYTSGSTGQPKGTVLEHRSLCTSLSVKAREIDLNEETRALQFAAYTFDIHVMEIFGTLIHGGCVCIISEHQRMNNLAQAINNLNANWMWLTPTVASILSPSAVPSIRTLLLGGEPLVNRVILAWAPFVRLIGTYGPSECSIHASMNLNLTVDTAPRNIGRGVGCHLWVVESDDVDRLVPVGCTGELLIEGPIVGREYFKRPDQTARAFITNTSWSNVNGHQSRRFYRTGDLTKQNADGTIYFIGRKDTQVKIHGQRVELGEIEHYVLKVFSMMAQKTPALPREFLGQLVVDVLTPQDATVPVLIAFVSPQVVSLESFQNFRETMRNVVTLVEEELFASIPRYMVPSVYLPIEVMPHLPSGKIDRGKLRELGQQLTSEKIASLRRKDASSQRAFTEHEDIVRKIWAQLLNIQPETINLHDNFFHIGGDSVVAMKVVRDLNRYGFSTTVADIFKNVRLSELACRMVKNDGETSHELRPFVGLDVSDEGSFLETQILPHLGCTADEVVNAFVLSNFQSIAVEKNLLHPSQHMNYFYLDLPSSVDVTRIERACHQLVQDFEILRTVFVKADGKLVQVVLKSIPSGFRRVAFNGDLTAFTAQLCLDDVKRPFVLGTSFVMFWFLESAKDTNRLVVRLSHAQYDGVSLELLLSAFVAIYSGKTSPSCRGFSTYIQHLTDHNRKSYPHWRALLEGSTFSILPTKAQLTSFEDSENIRVIKTIPNLSDVSNTTPATLFTAACALALGNVMRTQDVVIGRLVSGRAGLPADCQTVIGPCMNIVPVRIRSNSHQDMNDILQSVQRQYIEATAYESTGLDEIVRYCTDWPASTKHYRTISQYQNIDESPLIQTADFSSHLQYYHIERAQPWAESVYMLGTPGKDGLRVLIGASTRYYDHTSIELLHKELCSTLNMLTHAIQPAQIEAGRASEEQSR